MSISCIRHQDSPVSAKLRSDRLPRNFLLGLTISALIWASLAVGTKLMIAEQPAESPRLTLLR